MCGICGKISPDKPPDRATVERMCARMAHRGPDASGIYADGVAVLGHRRLAVLDTSPAGNQPMTDSTGRFHIVYNGEVYNFLQLKRELEGAGSVFRTATDTEVVLEAYKRWGAACLERFNGMFAFAVWDSRERTLFLARDRLGKKPLFYAPLPGGGLVFASELKAVVEDPDVPVRLNPKALSHYLSLNYTLTAECIVEGVKKLEAAHYVLLRPGGAPRETKYWDLAAKFRDKKRYGSEAEAAEELLHLLDDSVRLRMISDVPLGAFLSGGIDSSSIAASMVRAGSAATTHTFSIGFHERGYSELPEARTAADFLGVSHHEKIVDADLASLLPSISYYFDEPFADTSLIPTYYLARFARDSVTVCLSGDGGDEVFAGYETYAADVLHRRTRSLPVWTVAPLRFLAGRLLPVTFDKVSFEFRLSRFLNGHALDSDRAHYFWRTIFTDAEKAALISPDLSGAVENADPFERFRKYGNEVGDCHYLDRAMYVDIKTWLVDDILVKVDRASMAHSLEARAPFLDYRIVEFAASLPVEMKMKGLRKKHILKESQKKRLPARVVERPKKGFNAPVSHWLTNTIGEYVPRPGRGGAKGCLDFLDAARIEKLFAEHTAGKRDNGLKLFGIINLDLWCGKYLK
ncbi:MAG: asparagine synthase (glutamine-hydrolyzing) [bacterium]